MNIYLSLIHENCINYEEYANLVTSRILIETREEANELIGYVEAHHIWPCCLCTDEQKKDHNNLVYLTAKEHFRAHILLTKLFVDKKTSFRMQNALNRFFRNNPWQKREITEDEYEFLKVNASNLMKERWEDSKFRNNLIIKHLTNWQDPEYIKRMSLANIESWTDDRKVAWSDYAKDQNFGHRFGNAIVTKIEALQILELMNKGWLFPHLIKIFNHLTIKIFQSLKANYTWKSIDRNNYPNISKFYGVKSQYNPNELFAIIKDLEELISINNKDNKSKKDLRYLHNSRYFKLLQQLQQ